MQQAADKCKKKKNQHSTSDAFDWFCNKWTNLLNKAVSIEDLILLK